MPAATLPRVRDESLDFALGPSLRAALAGDLVCVPLYPNEMAIVVRRGHALAAKRSLADLIDSEWITAGLGTASLVVDDMFTAAERYGAGKRADPNLPTDVRFEAMRSIFKPGPDERRTQRPVYFEVNDYDAIQQAVTLGARHGLRMVLIGGADAPQCADLLNRHGVSVIVDGTYKFPKRDDSPYNDPYTLPARLESAPVAHAPGSPPSGGGLVSHGGLL